MVGNFTTVAREKTQERVKYPCPKEDGNSKFCGTSDSSLEQKGGGRRLAAWSSVLACWEAGLLPPQATTTPASFRSLPRGECILGP